MQLAVFSQRMEAAVVRAFEDGDFSFLCKKELKSFILIPSSEQKHRRHQVIWGKAFLIKRIVQCLVPQMESESRLILLLREWLVWSLRAPSLHFWAFFCYLPDGTSI